MLFHFLNLWWRIIHGMPVLVSSNWAAWILGILTFGFTELLLFMNTPREQRWKRLKGNVLIGLLVTAFVYTILFVWSTVQTTYDNHHDVIGRWQAVVNEKNKLKSGLQDKDEYIKRLEEANRKLCAGGQGLSRSVKNEDVNQQLRETTLDLVRKFRDLQVSWDNEDTRIRNMNLLPGISPQVRQSLMSQAGRDADRKFQPLRAQAQALQKQLLIKLPPQEPNESVNSLLEYGILVGAEPLYQLANYFEQLAQMLPKK